MLHRVTLVRTDVSGERIASIIRVTRIGELGTPLAVRRNSIFSQRASVASNRYGSSRADSGHIDVGGTTFLKNIASYKGYTA
jgi:hypothetical protein